MGTCVADYSFTDAHGKTCENWYERDCDGAEEFWGFDKEDAEALKTNCCAVCSDNYDLDRKCIKGDYGQYFEMVHGESKAECEASEEDTSPLYVCFTEGGEA